jgi:hypothetical protein
VFGLAILHRLALAVRRALLTLVLLLAAPAHASAAAPAQCPGAAIRADRAIAGAFPADLQGSYVRVPFDVPAGTTSVRVKYCYDQPEVPTPNVKHTLDLGIYDPRGFRGWGGSSHPDVTLSADPARTLVRRARPGRHRRHGARRFRQQRRLAGRGRALLRPRRQGLQAREVPEEAGAQDGRLVHGRPARPRGALRYG